MARKNKEEIQPIEASFDDVSDAMIAPVPLERPIVQVIHKGNFKDKFGVDVDCYVLNDEEKTVVLSQRGLGIALGMDAGGDHVPRLLRRIYMRKYVAQSILEKLDNPLIFNISNPAQNNIAYGYDITFLAEICDSIIDAYADGNKSITKETYERARRLDKAAKKQGWKSLGWAIAGYNPKFNEVIEGFNKFLVEEMSRDYAQEFPPELYIEWSKIYKFPLKVGRNHHVKCRWLTIDHVYTPLLRSNGAILRLLKEKRNQDDKGSYKKLFQYLNEEVGAPALRKHLQQLLAIATTAKGNREKYEEDFNTLFGMQLQFDFSKLEESN